MLPDATRIRCTLHATEPADRGAPGRAGPDIDIGSPDFMTFAIGGEGLSRSGGVPAGRGGGSAARSWWPGHRADLVGVPGPRSSDIADADRGMGRLATKLDKFVMLFCPFEEENATGPIAGDRCFPQDGLCHASSSCVSRRWNSTPRAS